jgi:hypothetical protein
MPLQATSGAASYDAFGGGVPVVIPYIEDVFSCFLYTGNGSTQTITNGIDLAGEGGLVWLKNRTTSGRNHILFDSERPLDKALITNSTAAETTISQINSPAFYSDGFNVFSSVAAINASGGAFASWTFRKQPKFFDVVTYTGTGANRTIAHNLGSVPGCIIVKRTDTTGDWQVYHRSLANTEYLVLNSDAAKATGATRWNSTTPTSTVFSVGTDATVNASGGTYVAYIFAHNAGGFGLTSTDNVISCGSYTGNGSATGPVVTLGYEPQWIFIKNASGASCSWGMYDNMRGIATGSNDAFIRANLSDAEVSVTNFIDLTSTGFSIKSADAEVNQSSNTYIYIAIRRGPMKVPTVGTSVFGLNARTGTGANATVTGGAGVSDAVLVKNRGSAVASLFSSRLTGTGYLVTSTEALEVAAGTTILQANSWDVMDGVKVGTSSTITNASANTFINYLFDRAPSFFDVVCYTGTSSARTISHNLTVAPEMMIVKKRSGSEIDGWLVYSSALGASSYVRFNSVNASAATASFWNATTPTASVFSLGNSTSVNASDSTYVWYGFATCAGVSKVGSYTGNGSTQTINCGFGAGGARFVLIKRTDSTGGWYVYDTARGMTVLTDPYFFLNTSAAESATLGSVTTVSTGFALDSTILAAINVSAATYIFLAIA